MPLGNSELSAYAELGNSGMHVTNPAKQSTEEDRYKDTINRQQ